MFLINTCFSSVVAQPLPWVSDEYYNITNFVASNCSAEAPGIARCLFFDYNLTISWSGLASTFNHDEPHFVTTCQGTIKIVGPVDPTPKPVACVNPDIAVNVEDYNRQFSVITNPWVFYFEVYHSFSGNTVYGDFVASMDGFDPPPVPSSFDVRKRVEGPFRKRSSHV